MNRWLRLCAATTLLIASSASYAQNPNFHLFQFDQIYSNADGTIQFVTVIFPPAGCCNDWTGNEITTSGAGGPKTFVFPSDLPGFMNTARKHVLIATQGFANLDIVTPDYIVPNGFLSIPDGTITFDPNGYVNHFDGMVTVTPGGFVDQVTYAGLPADGVSAFAVCCVVVPNVATNFAGESGSVTPVTEAAFVPIDGVWANAAESGRGFALGYKHGVLIVAIYAYLPNGQAQWYLASGPVVNNVFTAALDKYVGGQCISCVYTGPPMVTGNDGTITITFTSNASATVNLPGGRVTQIVPFQF
jgi:hypothetical protein